MITLFQHQQKALDLTEGHNRCAYYLDMGLGKTFVGSEKMKELNTRINLVVCQCSKVPDWIEHFQTYYTRNCVFDLTDPKTFKWFMEQIQCEVPTLMIGVINYCLYRRNELGKAFILIGDKSNGKSTFLHVVKNMLGDRNIASLDLKELGDRFKTAELFGKLANIGDDIGDEFIANASVFKKLVTGDRVNVERKGQDPFEFNNYAKFLFSANNIPRMKDKTGAVQRRLVIVPFDAKFTPNDPDFRPFIKDELCEQDSMEYLILLGLNALRRVLMNAQFTTSSRVQGQLDEYEQNNNPIIGFIQEIGLDGIINETTDTIYRRYKEYCISNNFQNLSKIEFSRQICRRCGLTTDSRRIKGRACRVFIEVKEGDS